MWLPSVAEMKLSFGEAANNGSCVSVKARINRSVVNRVKRDRQSTVQNLKLAIGSDHPKSGQSQCPAILLITYYYLLTAY